MIIPLLSLVMILLLIIIQIMKIAITIIVMIVIVVMIEIVQDARGATSPDRPRATPRAAFGKGQMGSALMGSLQFLCF